MARFALGLIEIVGLVAAVEAADAAVKSANVKLIGYELAKGGGLVTIKLEGEVGAVQAAVQAGCAAGAKVNKVLCSLVIPRPHEDLKVMTSSKDTTGLENKVESVSKEKDFKESEVEAELPNDNTNLKNEAAQDIMGSTAEVVVNEIKATCNLCSDPACTRKKGEPRNLCIHYENHKIKKED